MKTTQAWYGRRAVPNSTVGLQMRREFASGLLDVGGDYSRRLWVPLGSDTTTSTDLTRNGATLTHAATLAGRYSTVGSGLFVSYNGTTDYSSYPDANDASFGDGVRDEPFSIAVWLNQTTAATGGIFAKYSGSNREYYFYMSSGKISFECWDESAAANIGRRYNTALATAAPILVIGTYDGSGISTGLRCYAYDGTAAGAVDDTPVNSGTYVGMENLVQAVDIGAQNAIAVFFAGSVGASFLAARTFTPDDCQRIRQLGNEYYALVL